ncbi:response regulator transcription factor [Actinospica robiniae]|uniref:response regulator transcription factor n=1 Tax=Actinospica robiniae TaxID=304901 RepID=UPI00040DBC0F|nr:response regulator transcription factor [Actinospica robiniae]
MRIVIAEDSVLLRAGLERLLDWAGFEVVGCAGDAERLLALVEEHQPDLAIVDIRMPPTFTDEGMRATLTLRQRWPEVAVLVLSQYVEERHATDLLTRDTAGVGYLLKDRVADVESFIETLRRLGDGGTALDPEVVAQLLVRSKARNPLGELTERELGVLSLMAEGRSNYGIASKLVISESAVAKHVKSIFMKLDLTMTDTDHRRVLAVLQFLAP